MLMSWWSLLGVLKALGVKNDMYKPIESSSFNVNGPSGMWILWYGTKAMWSRGLFSHDCKKIRSYGWFWLIQEINGFDICKISGLEPWGNTWCLLIDIKLGLLWRHWKTNGFFSCLWVIKKKEGTSIYVAPSSNCKRLFTNYRHWSLWGVIFGGEIFFN